MPRKKIPYKEGDWFAVPLRNGGYALGLIARLDGKGGFLGYFFGPRHEQIPVQQDTISLSSSDAILIRHFGDLGLLREEWPIIFHPDAWSRADWPLPAFARIAVDEGWALRVEYSETDISKPLHEASINLEEARRLPEDGVSGYGAIEIRLTKLLST